MRPWRRFTRWTLNGQFRKSKPWSNLSESTALSRTTAAIVSLFAAFAFLLATSGLYASVTYSYAERRVELAIRSALGATPAKLLRLIFAEVSCLIVPGVLLGSAIGIAGSNALKTLLFGVGPANPKILGMVTMIMVTASMIACWLPIRGSLKLDPMQCLRHE